jgi:Domain of unknown function (DUF6456)
MPDPVVLPERLQHDRIDRAVEQIVDALGHAGAPYRVETMLGRMERHGSISARQRLAGEQFGRLFRLAQLDPLHAADMGQRTHGAVTDAHRSLWARERVNAALDALGGLGSPCGTAAWVVLGMELTVGEWCRREGWGGRPINAHVGKGTLVGALGVLVRHFGL